MPDTAQTAALGITLPTVGIAIVALRLYVRRKVPAFGLDDFFALTCLVVCMACSVILIIGALHFGFGKHSSNQTSEEGYADNSDLMDRTKVLSAALNYLVPLGLGQAKLSLLFFYRRIFRGHIFNILSWTLIGLATAWTITFFLLSLLQCGPRVFLLWTSAKNIVTHCLEGEPIALADSGIDFSIDLLILVFPIYWTSRLRMHRARKILVVMVFLFGFVAAFASLARLIVFAVVYPGHNSDPDQLSYLTHVSYWRCLELGLALIACCLPTLSGLLSERASRRLTSFVNRILPSRLKTSRQYSDIDGPKHRMIKLQEGQDNPRQHLANFNDTIRGERHTGVESHATSEGRLLSTSTEAITVTTTTTQIATRRPSADRCHAEIMSRPKTEV